MKRPGEQLEGGHNKRYGSGIPKAKYAFKALCPDDLVTALLGARGAVKDEIQADTNTKLVFSNKGDYFPETQFRVLGIYSDEAPNNIVRVVEWALMKLIEYGDHERVNPAAHGQAVYVGKESGEYIWRLTVNARASSALIGPGGSRIQKMRRETNAKVFVENTKFFGDQLVRVIGVPESIMKAVSEINEIIQTDAGSDEFSEWSRVLNFGQFGSEAPGGGDGSGGGGKGKWGKGNKGKSQVPPPQTPAPASTTAPEEPQGDATQDEEPWAYEFSEGWEGDGQDGAQEGEAINGWESSHAGAAESMDIDDRIDVLSGAVGSLPAGTANMQYSITFDIPGFRADALITEQDREYLAHVERTTGAQIDVPHAAESPEMPRLVSLVGQLMHVYAAHILIQKKIKELDLQEAEAARLAQEAQEAEERAAQEAWEAEQEAEGEAEADEDEADEIAKRIEELQKQLEAARAKKTGGDKGKAKGKGKDK